MTLPLHTRSGAPGVLRGRRNVGPSCCRTALPPEVAAVVGPGMLLLLIRMRLATVFVGAPMCPDACRRLHACRRCTRRSQAQPWGHLITRP